MKLKTTKTEVGELMRLHRRYANQARSDLREAREVSDTWLADWLRQWARHNGDMARRCYRRAMELCGLIDQGRASR